MVDSLLDLSKSISIRQVILITQKRFKTYISELKILSLAIDNSKYQAQNHDHLKDINYVVECFIKKLKNIIETFNEKNKEWGEIQKTL